MEDDGRARRFLPRGCALLSTDVDTGCPFCRIADGTEGTHLVYEDPTTVAFLDLRPLFPGHTLVVPREHHATLADLPKALLEPYFATVQMLSRAVVEAMGATGTFVAMNNIVSQSVAHLHCHVVPRNPKDGLRGFFWPRTKYSGEAEMSRIAEAIRAVTPDGGRA